MMSFHGSGEDLLEFLLYMAAAGHSGERQGWGANIILTDSFCMVFIFLFSYVNTFSSSLYVKNYCCRNFTQTSNTSLHVKGLNHNIYSTMDVMLFSGWISNSPYKRWFEHINLTLFLSVVVQIDLYFCMLIECCFIYIYILNNHLGICILFLVLHIFLSKKLKHKCFIFQIW
jgi:hypothetical protein